jgi:hypothetical protein
MFQIHSFPIQIKQSLAAFKKIYILAPPAKTPAQKIQSMNIKPPPITSGRRE